MEITFTKMQKKHVDEVIDLCNLCFDEHTTKEHAKAMWEKTCKDPNSIYIIGLIQGKIVAHLKITVIETIYDGMGTYAILNHVCVHPDYRRHKIGTKLLDCAFKECKKRKCKAVELWSKNFRVAAHKLYQEYGFIIEDAKFFSKEI